MDAAFYDSNGQPKNSVRAPDYLVGDELAYNINTASPTSGSLANGTRSGSLQSITVTGDGVNPVWVEWHCYAPFISAGGTNGHFNIELWDGTVGSGTLLTQSQVWANTTGQSSGQTTLMCRIAPFTGSKTLNISVYRSDGGTATITLQSGATYPMVLRATKLKSAGVYGAPSVQVHSPLISGSAQITSGSEQVIDNWQSESWDTHGMHNGTNPSRLTAPVSGLYTVDFVFDLAAKTPAANAIMYQFWRKNGDNATKRFFPVVLAASSISTVVRNISALSETIKLNAGDYIELGIYQNMGATVAFTTGDVGMRASLTYVGPSVEVQQRPGSPAGWVTRTSTASAGISANASSASLYSMTVTGDGASYLELEAGFSHAGNSAGGIIAVQIWDGTPGSGINVGEVAYAYFAGLAASQWVPIRTNPVRIAPFTGTKTFNVTIYCGTAGTYTVHSGGTPTGNAAAFIKGTWF